MRIGQKMKELTIEELKEVELNILKDVAKFCEINKIQYFLCGGTLLGAIRHKGFIPWDDDIDIAMPRADYERFFKLYNGNNSRYKADSLENNNNWHMSFGRVGDINTVLYEHTLKNKYKKYHAFIDIFPVDGLPNNIIKKKLLLLTQKFLGIIGNSSAFSYTPSKHFSDSKENNIELKNKIRTYVKYIFITLCKGLNTQKIFSLVNSISKRYKIETSDIIGLTVYVWNWKFEILNKSSIHSYVELPFEDTYFLGPKGYAEYLENTFGDYMIPPPEERRVSHHNFNVYWKE